VRVYDELDIFDPTSQRTDVGNDQWCRLRKRAVDEDMACAGGDQNGAQTVSTDVVSIAIDSEGRVRLVPGSAIGAGRMHVPSEKRKNQDQKQQDSTVHLTSVRDRRYHLLTGHSHQLKLMCLRLCSLTL